MSSHCEGQPPATVLIQFKNGAKETVISADVPVEVEVKKKTGLETQDPDPNAPTGGCCDIPYSIKLTYEACTPDRFDSSKCEGETVTREVETGILGKVLSSRITEFQGIPNAVEVTRIGCDKVEQKVNIIGLSGERLISYAIQEIKRADGKPDICDPPDDDTKRCVITVKNSSGETIYKKEDDCPIKYKVRCADQCAEGEIRCKKPQYPGYCCIDCEDARRRLNR